MFRTRAGDFRISSDVKIDDITKINVAHNDPSGTVEIEYDDGFTVDIASGSGSQRYWPGDWTDGVVFRFSTFTAYMTELEIQGMLALRVDQLPPQLTKFSHDGGVFNVLDPFGSGQYVKFEGLTMGGKSLPTGLVDLHAENVRSPADVDRIIEALETNAQNNGSLFLAEQRLSKTAELLETRGWTVELEPQYAHKIERSKAPHTSVIDGKAVHHVDRRRGGSRRKQFEGRCIELNGTSEYAESGSVSWTGADTLTISVWVKATADGFVIGHWNSGTTYTALIQILAGGFPRVYVSMDGTASNFRTRSSTTDIRDGQWHHIALRYQAGTLEGYLDGELFDGSTVTTGSGTAINQTPSTIVLGADTGGAGANEFPGKIYDPQIFDTALPATQIQALAEAGPQSLKPTLSSVPLIWLPMDDATSSPTIRNYGSLGSAGDFTITGTPSAVWSTQDRFSYPNAFGASAALVTNGVDSYVDTGVTLNGATAFTVLMEVRHLSTNAYDISGFANTAGSKVRIGRDTGNEELLINYGSGSDVLPTTSVPDGEFLQLELKSTSGGNYNVRVNGTQVANASAGTFTISNALNFLLGASDVDGTPLNFSHAENTRLLIASRAFSDDEQTHWRTRGASGTAFDSAADPDIHVDYRFDQPHPRIVHNYADPGNPGKIVGDCEWIAVNHDPANPTKDMNGKALTWKGQVPRDAVISSPAVELNGTSEYVSKTGLSIGTSYPVTFSAKFKVDSGYVGPDTIVSVVNAGDSSIYYRLGVESGNLRLDRRDGGEAADIKTVAAVSADEWHDATVELVSDTAFNVWLDGTKYSYTGEASVSLATSSLDAFVAGTLRLSSPTHWFEGSIAGAQLSTTAQTDEAMSTGDLASPLLHWPCCEKSGDICWDISGNGNHGTGAPTARTGSQNLSDHLITNGFAKGTHFDGASDNYDRPKLLSGSASWSAGCYLIVDSLAANRVFLSQYLTTGNQREFQWYVTTAGALRCNPSGDGATVGSVYTADGLIEVGKLYHVAVAVDGANNTAKLFIDGVDVTSTVSAIPSTLFDGTATLTVGANTGGTIHYAGTLSQLLIHDGAYWTAGNVASLMAAGTTAEMQTVVDSIVGGTAWYFPDANTNETLQGLTSGWTTNGAPEERVIPAGAGVPITYGPGIAAPGQDRLIAAEPNSPFALRYAGDYSLGTGDLVYEAVFGSGASHVDLGATLIGATDDFDISLDFLITSFSADAKAVLFGQYTTAVAGRMLLQANSDLSITAFVDHTTDVLIVTSTDIIQLNRWHSVRFVRVGDDFELFVDGVSAGTQTQSGISVEQSNSFLSSTNVVLDELNGKIRNIRIDNAGTVTERLTRGIALPGATLTNVTVSSKEYGAIGGRILFQKPDGTANLYETSMSAEMADIIASRKYY